MTYFYLLRLVLSNNVIAMALQGGSIMHALNSAGGFTIKTASLLFFYIIGSRTDKHRILAAEIRNLAMLGYHLTYLLSREPPFQGYIVSSHAVTARP